jgi:hypothetical protein
MRLLPDGPDGWTEVETSTDLLNSENDGRFGRIFLTPYTENSGTGGTVL